MTEDFGTDESSSLQPRGCQFPGCGVETRAYVTWHGKDYCHKCIRIVQAEDGLERTFKPLEGTGEP